MIEALNIASVQSTGFRAGLDSSSSVRSYAANPQRIQEVASTTPSAVRQSTMYLSPIVSRDVASGQYVTILREAASGDVVRQSPTELILRMRALREQMERAQLLENQESLGGIDDVLDIASNPAIARSAAVETGVVAPVYSSFSTEA